MNGIETPDLSDLETFARHAIGAEHYPDDIHPCNVTECEKCGVAPLELTIEHDAGSERGDFRGVIWIRCPQCGERRELLGMTSYPERGETIQVETPACECGGRAFYVMLCDRIEVWDAESAFFDEGVVAGKCASCGKLRTFVFTD